MGNSRQGYNKSDIRDIGSEIIKIVRNIINNEINAPFLAKVVAVSNNKVDVIPLDINTFNNIPLNPVVYNNVLVGLLYTSKINMTIPINIGDIGLCIVTDRDITNYANTGNGGIPASKRRFSKMDAIFVPLSMFLQEQITEDFIFKYFGKPNNNTFKIAISNNNTLSVQGGNNGDAFKLDIDESGNTVYDIDNGTINMSLNIDDGIIIKDNNGNNIEVGSKGVIVEDLNGNKIGLGTSGVVIEDLNGNKIELSASGININNGALEITK